MQALAIQTAERWFKRTQYGRLLRVIDQLNAGDRSEAVNIPLLSKNRRIYRPKRMTL